MSASELSTTLETISAANSLAAHLPEFALNTSDTAIRSHIRSNIRLQLPQVRSHENQDTELVLLGGGWSLTGQVLEIQKLIKGGARAVTMNGTHDWALAHNIKPAAHVMLDAREFNAKFVQNYIASCKYLIASQCHPRVFDTLKNHPNTFIWHAATNHMAEREVLDDYYLGHWLPIIGGSTVMLRTLTLMTLLGFRNFHAFGFDSCLHPASKEHHAYAQQENDRADVIQFTSGGREWACQTWMASQALDFLNQRKSMGGEWNLQVYGDGLIAHLLKQKDEG